MKRKTVLPLDLSSRRGNFRCLGLLVCPFIRKLYFVRTITELGINKFAPTAMGKLIWCLVVARVPKQWAYKGLLLWWLQWQISHQWARGIALMTITTSLVQVPVLAQKQEVMQTAHLLTHIVIKLHSHCFTANMCIWKKKLWLVSYVKVSCPLWLTHNLCNASTVLKTSVTANAFIKAFRATTRNFTPFCTNCVQINLSSITKCFLASIAIGMYLIPMSGNVFLHS